MRRISAKTETQNLLPLEWCIVKHQPIISNIKDEEVRKNTAKIREFHRVHSDHLPKILKELKKERVRFIEVIPDVLPLPLECPVCHNEGSPTIIDDKRKNKFSYVDFHGNKIQQYEKYLRYNHPNGKSCRIGKYKIIKINHPGKTPKEIPSLVLRKSLKPEDVGFRKITHKLSNGNAEPLK